MEHVAHQHSDEMHQLRAEIERQAAEIERLRAFEWAWSQLSADLRTFIASETPEPIRRVLTP